MAKRNTKKLILKIALFIIESKNFKYLLDKFNKVQDLYNEIKNTVKKIKR